MKTSFSILLLPIFLFPMTGGAITLKGYFAKLEPSGVVIDVGNSENKNALVSVSVVEVDSPRSDSEIKMQAGEILFTPAKQIIRKKSSQGFKFYYRGPSSSKERYFRVAFTEMPGDALTRKEAAENQRRGVVSSMVSLGYVLVLPPKSPQQFSLINRKGVTNTGNVTIMLRAAGMGKDNKPAQLVLPLMPGQSASFSVFKASEVISGTIEGGRKETFLIKPD